MINIFDGTTYFFPYKEFVNNISDRFVSHKIKSYVQRWICIFELLEKNVDDDFNKFLSRYNTYQAKNKRYEYFQLSQNYDFVTGEYIFHFDVERIKNRLSKTNSKIYLTSRLKKSVYYDSDIILKSSEIKSHPIIIFPFLTSSRESHISEYVVVDGNKYLTYRIVNHKLFSKAIFVPNVLYTDFVFLMDWALYLFLHETNTFLSWYDITELEGNIESIGILNSSYFISAFENVRKK